MRCLPPGLMQKPCALTQVCSHHDLDALIRAHGGQRREVVGLGHCDAVADPALRWVGFGLGSGQGVIWTERERLSTYLDSCTQPNGIRTLQEGHVYSDDQAWP